MSKWIGFLAILATASLSQAQQPATLSDSAKVLYHRIDSLLPAYKQARLAMTQYDSVQRQRELRRTAEPMDSTVVGPFKLIAARRQSEVAFALFRDAYEKRQHEFEGVRIGKQPVLLMEIGRPVPYLRKWQRGSAIYSVWSPSRKAAERRHVMDRKINEMTADFLPDTLRKWVGDGLAASPSDVDVNRELATGIAAVTKGCYRGEATQCVDALGISGDGARDRWYTPDQIRMMVVRGAGVGTAYERRQCISAMDLNMCNAVLRSWGGAPEPVSRAVRGSFLVHVMTHGKPGIIVRLQQASGDPATAIKSAAGSDVNQLAQRWVEDVERSAERESHRTANVGLSVSIWVAITLGLSLRSTRRRIG